MALLNYPILQAADILIYKASLVPAGEDQEPHIEVTREIAKKMNQTFGTDFPETKRIAQGISIPSLAGEGKMSKSVEGSYISLIDPPEAIWKKIRAVPTATSSGGEMNTGIKTLFALLQLFGPADVHSFQKQYDAGTLKFVELKDRVADLIAADLEPFRTRRAELEADPAYVEKVIQDGAERARAIARVTIAEVRQAMGLS